MRQHVVAGRSRQRPLYAATEASTRHSALGLDVGAFAGSRRASEVAGGEPSLACRAQHANPRRDAWAKLVAGHVTHGSLGIAATVATAGATTAPVRAARVAFIIE